MHVAWRKQIDAIRQAYARYAVGSRVMLSHGVLLKNQRWLNGRNTAASCDFFSQWRTCSSDAQEGRWHDQGGQRVCGTHLERCH